MRRNYGGGSMAGDDSTRCWYCSGTRLELDPDVDPELGLYWCHDCGRPNTIDQAHWAGAPESEMPECMCAECGRPMLLQEDGSALHADQFKAPKCSVHREELVALRRSRLRLLKGGRA